MKNRLLLGLVVAVAHVTVSRPAAQAIPAAAGIIQYASSQENFPNPERGFYRMTSPFFVDTQRTPLEANQLATLRAEGMTLFYAIYVFDEFRDTDLPQSTLDAVASDLAAVRQAGLKIVLRFAYNFPCVGTLEPCSTPISTVFDAPLSRVLRHIDQLTPILRTNADVIAYLEAGFVGAWGEWHDSSNLLINSDQTANASSAALVNRLLLALPTERMLALRYYHNKQELVGSTSPLAADVAFSGVPRARLGGRSALPARRWTRRGASPCGGGASNLSATCPASSSSSSATPASPR